MDFKLGKNYLILYSIIDVNRYKSGYDTDCHDYQAHLNNSIRSDCIVECLLNYKIESQMTHHFPYFIHENVASRYKLGDLFYNIHQEHQDICDTQCKTDCKFKFYRIDYFGEVEHRNGIVDLLLKDGEYVTKITLQHSNSPDIVVKHYPEVTFISLACDFGGLLGMWLGLSIMVVLNSLIDSIKMFYIYSPRINNNNILVNYHGFPYMGSNPSRYPIRYNKSLFNRSHSRIRTIRAWNLY